MSEKSSTSMISLSKCLGDRPITEWTVLNSTLHASLWKQMITAVTGKSFRKLCERHLQVSNKIAEISEVSRLRQQSHKKLQSASSNIGNIHPAASLRLFTDCPHQFYLP